MKGKILRLVIGVIVIADALVGAFFIGRESVDGVNSDLLEELERLRSERSEIAITKRVSQQMEDIAYQQKAVSDFERVRAEEQSRLALAMKDKAEQESRSARQAERMAVDAAADAEELRAKALELQQMAEVQRDEANHSKSVADTLAFRVLGRNLATSSLTQYESGDRELGAQLAYVSWYFLSLYCGNVYQPEVFESLSTCSNSRGSIQTKMGGAVTDMCRLDSLSCIVVTDYGEVELHRRLGARRKVICQNHEYNFSGVWADTSTIYALSHRGPLCRIGYDGKVTEIPVPAGTYLKLICFAEGKILLVEKNSMFIVDTDSGEISAQVTLDGELSAVMETNGRILFFHRDGRYGIADSELKVSYIGSYAPKTVTSALYDDRLAAFFLGCDDGDILILDRDMNLVTTLFGHSGRVSDLMVAGSLAISASYDKQIFIWNLPLLHVDSEGSLARRLGIPEDRLSTSAKLSTNEWLSPAYMKYSSWPLALCPLNDEEIVVGTANGQVQIVNISADCMAGKIRKDISAPLTDLEWNRFIGSSIPYIRL